MTNLSDALHTQVVIDNGSGIDIGKLNEHSTNVDENVSRRMHVKELTVNVKRPRRVVMVKPLHEIKTSYAADESGVYIDTQALKKSSNAKDIFVTTLNVKHLLVNDIAPLMMEFNSLNSIV